MKYLKFTYVDAATGVPVTEAPAVNGPKFPAVDGLQFAFALESQYPTLVPTFFGTCPDDAFALVPGVIDVVTQVDFERIHTDELYARAPKVVSMRQARLALLQNGLLTQVDATIATMPGVEGEAARIEWEYATEVRRDSALTTGLAGALALSEQQLNELFTLAATL